MLCEVHPTVPGTVALPTRRIGTNADMYRNVPNEHLCSVFVDIARAPIAALLGHSPRSPTIQHLSIIASLKNKSYIGEKKCYTHTQHTHTDLLPSAFNEIHTTEKGNKSRFNVTFKRRPDKIVSVFFVVQAAFPDCSPAQGPRPVQSA